jgi:ribosome maturation factor RimP
MELAAKVREVVEAVLAPSGLELWDVETRPGLVRVVVDRPGGVDLDTLAIANRLVSDGLDREDPMPAGRYRLEVSSPGVERPLRTPQHFQRAVGATVSLKTKAGTSSVRRLQGRLVSADDDGVVVAPEGEESPVALSYNDIDRARTVLSWGPTAPAAPASRSRTKRAAAR